MKQNVQDLIGQKLMVGVEGSEPTSAMIKRFQKIRPGGLILFRPNFDTQVSLKRLIEELEKAAGRKLIVAVDHEGGRVVHIPHGVTVFPDNLALGMSQKESYARRQGEIEARELRRLGIDLNLAPTVDVLTENFSPNIGIRSYGSDPALVSALGVMRIQGMQENGLSACAKHFPGLGSAPVDPHLDLPVLSSGWDEMNQIHLKPFRAAIEAGVDAVMTSHPVYPKLDPDRLPVTFSRKLAHNFLREELKFKGLLLSDDLEMGALRNFGSIEICAVKAIEAGHDMALICHDIDAQVRTWESLLAHYEKNKLSVDELLKSADRVESFNHKRSARFEKGTEGPEPDGRLLAEKIALESVVKQKIKPIPSEEPILVLFPQLSAMSKRIFIENEIADERQYVSRQLTRMGVKKFEVVTVPMQPAKEEVAKYLRIAAQFNRVLFFCYDAQLDSRTRELLLTLQKIGTDLMTVLMRDPYDKEFIHSGGRYVQAFGFRRVQLDAVFQALFAH